MKRDQKSSRYGSNKIMTCSKALEILQKWNRRRPKPDGSSDKESTGQRKVKRTHFTYNTLKGKSYCKIVQDDDNEYFRK